MEILSQINKEERTEMNRPRVPPPFPRSPVIVWRQQGKASIEAAWELTITKTSGSWVRINTAKALGIVWRVRIRAKTIKWVATKPDTPKSGIREETEFPSRFVNLSGADTNIRDRYERWENHMDLGLIHDASSVLSSIFFVAMLLEVTRLSLRSDTSFEYPV